MLYSKFYIGDDRYVIAISEIVAVVPYVNLKIIPSLPGYAAGLLGYNGCSVPVIDLCRLFIDRSCERKLSSRIILVKIKVLPDTERMIGLLVERATDTFFCESDAFVDPGMYNPDLPFVGPVVNDSKGVMTKILPQKVFEKIDEKLFFPGGVVTAENK